MNINKINIITRNVKYPRLELKTGQPCLILPKNGHHDPHQILVRHKVWLEQRLTYIQKLKNQYQNEVLHQRSRNELIQILQTLVQIYSQTLMVAPPVFTVRLMKTKWGSCNPKRNKLTFNLLLKYLPHSLIKYVVFHEMAHLIIPNHKTSFWQLVRQYFYQPARYEESLLGYWFLINKNNLSHPLSR